MSGQPRQKQAFQPKPDFYRLAILNDGTLKALEWVLINETNIFLSGKVFPRRFLRIGEFSEKLDF